MYGRRARPRNSRFNTTVQRVFVVQTGLEPRRSPVTSTGDTKSAALTRKAAVDPSVCWRVSDRERSDDR
jgi:hypothetical protein